MGDQSQPHHVGDGIHHRRNLDELCVPLCPRCHVCVHSKPKSYREELRMLAEKTWKEYLQTEKKKV